MIDVAEPTQSARPPIPADRLHAVGAGILTALGVSRAHADTVASLLVEADLAGLVSHGSGLIPQYVAELDNGTLDPRSRPFIAADTGSRLVVDAGTGFGQIAGLVAAHHAIERASAHGYAAVTVRGSAHIGAPTVYVERVARAGRICLFLDAACPQEGGGRGQVVAYAVPTGVEPLIVFDRTVSETCAGFPDGRIGWSGEQEGVRLLVDVLAATAIGFGSVDSRGVRTGDTAREYMLLAIDPRRFMPLPAFRARMDSVARELGRGPDRAADPATADDVRLEPDLRRELDSIAARLSVQGLTDRLG